MTICPVGTFRYHIQPGDSLWLITQRYHTTVQAIASVNPAIDFNNLTEGQILIIPQSFESYHLSMQTSTHYISTEEDILSNHLRLLWEQHVYWTRMVILSMAFDLPDVELVTNRLLQNPKDFEAVLIPFYGEDVASEFAKLFTSHIAIAAELVEAAKSGNSDKADDAEKRWYENADEIAVFLESINPYWSEQEWKKMLYDHLEMTKTEAVDILTGNYADSITLFENIEQEALVMADMMTQGIVRQFFQYFS